MAGVLGASVAVTLGAGASRPDEAPKTFSSAPTLPDLNDPSVRRSFVCSFAAGSFGIPSQSSPVDASNDCGDDAATAP